jgi:hypothetical protein
MKTEKAIQQEILVSTGDIAMLFRTNAGKAFNGTMAVIDGQRVLKYPRGINLLPKGYSDLSGHRESDGRAVYIETKDHKGKPTKEQINFLERMRKSGALAGVARSVEDARDIIGGA